MNSENACNGHGRPKSRSSKDLECDCDKGFGGKFCDYCLDATQAYPDCSFDGPKAEIYDQEASNTYLTRRKYNQGYSTAAKKYFPHGILEASVFNEECGWVDFPDDLDRIEFSREFKEGEFHFSDIYVVNHKQDNIMKFVPRSHGVFKILL